MTRPLPARDYPRCYVDAFAARWARRALDLPAGPLRSDRPVAADCAARSCSDTHPPTRPQGTGGPRLAVGSPQARRRRPRDPPVGRAVDRQDRATPLGGAQLT